jgi:FkbM family methyltransferase
VLCRAPANHAFSTVTVSLVLRSDGEHCEVVNGHQEYGDWTAELSKTISMEPDLIYDVGLHDGSDTAYYLEKGFRVVAIEANPLLTSQAQGRFRKEIASGQLTVLDVGIGASEESLSFWINQANDTQSSFDKDRAMRYGPCHEAKVKCVPLSVIIDRYGVPYYLKIDIEGNDYLCVNALVPGKLPKYISVELDPNRDLVRALHQLGYNRFKVINQTSFTDSTPIFRNEIGLRFSRKLSSKFPWLKGILKSPGISSRLRKIDFDSFLDRFDHKFPEGSSGPFGEETWGPWYSFEEIRARIDSIQTSLAAGQVAQGAFWMDIHATISPSPCSGFGGINQSAA